VRANGVPRSAGRKDAPLAWSKIARRRDQGFGQGTGADYRPWLRPRELPKQGILRQLVSIKHGRQHALVGDFEQALFVVAEWPLKTRDMRERFPLLPIDCNIDTMAIARKIGVKHPTAPGSAEPAVMTTTLRTFGEPDGDPIQQSLAFVRLDDLSKPRVLDKLEIARIYALKRGWQWRIVTQLEAPQGLVNNILRLRAKWHLKTRCVAGADVDAVADRLFRVLTSRRNRPLAELCQAEDSRQSWDPSTSLSVVWHALARRFWRVPDLCAPLDPLKPLLGLTRVAGPPRT
jgi:hypothetical protein